MAASRKVDRRCPECGRTVPMKVVTGRLHGHHVPGTHRDCSGNGMQLEEPRTDADAWEPAAPRRLPTGVVEGIARVDPKWAAGAPVPLSELDSVSVRTISAGMPGSNRRR